jgi:hypothetical protein
MAFPPPPGEPPQQFPPYQQPQHPQAAYQQPYPPQPPHPPGPPRGRSVPWWAWVVAIAVVLLVFGVGFAAGRGSRPSPSAQPAATSSVPRSTVAAPPTTSGGTSSASGAAPSTPGVGGTVHFDDGSGTTGTITLNGIRRITRPEGPIGGTPEHGSYLVADVTIAVATGSGISNPLAFRAQSADGATYDSALGVLNHQITSGDVPAGRQVRGEVAFDAPQGPLLIDYTTPLSDVLATFAVTG